MSIPKMNDYIDSTHYYRGLLINEFNALESAIGYHIFEHFKNENKFDFYTMVLDRMSVDSKMQILRAIVNKKEIKRGFIKTTKNGYPNGRLFDLIRQCKDKRNHFAHFQIVIPPKNEKTVISLAEFRDGFSRHDYDLDILNEWISKIRKCTKDLELLMSSY